MSLTFGLETDPPGALARMAGLIEQVSRSHGVEESLWMTLGLTDGSSFYGVRYASDGEAPTLFHSRGIEDLCKLNPALRERFGPTARVLVSEPSGRYPEMWSPVPQGSLVIIRGGDFEIRPFRPAPDVPVGSMPRPPG